MSYERPGKAVLALEFDSIKVGDVAELSHSIEALDVEKFAKLTGDYNPLHVDAEFARKTLFHRPVVHGMLTASFISTIIGTMIPGTGALWVSQSLDFIAPAFIGDRITVRSSVEQKSVATRTLVLATVITNQSGQVLVRGESRVRLLQLVEEPRAMTTPDSNRVALVVGASRGIGAAIATRLAENGHAVAINYYRSERDACDLAETLIANGHRAFAVYADASKPEDIRAMSEKIGATLGPIEDVIYCAAAAPIPTPFEETDWTSFQTQIDVQLRGAFSVAKAVLPAMVERSSGSLLFIGSIFADGVPPVQQAAYVTVKAALAAFARALAVEYGPKGIRVNTIAPGMTQTDMISTLPDKVKLLTKMQTPLRRLAEVDDIAQVAQFMVSPGARHITGETIRVCGGIAMV